MIRFFPVAAALLCAAAAAAGGITVDNGCLRVEFADPAGALGCRFLRAGWITGLYPAEGRDSVFHLRSIFDFHVAFGCPQEIVPELELEPGRALKLGVGVVVPNPKDSALAEPVELLPWHTGFRREPGKTRLTARQSCPDRAGYAYELTVTVTVEDDSPVIVYEQVLENTGRRRIKAEAYLHPFFRTPGGFASAWFRLPGRERQPVAAAPHQAESVCRPERGPYQVSAGGLTERNCTVTIAADRPLYRSRFWRNNSDCFAVEPFIAIDVAPGERQAWSWRVTLLAEEEVRSGRIGDSDGSGRAVLRNTR